MATSLPMKCFVAMAFGHADADQMYEKQICSVLAAKKIKVVRIDRLEHNDNIDDRIFAEIDSADFVIADLSYARPSVYFEAGYAERMIPVIYTARRDHFGHTPNDKFGVFRVHFDVATRNIIDWLDPDDALFTQRLASRVDHVTAPILERKAASDNVQARRRAFRAQAQHERASEVWRAAKTALKELRYLDFEALKSVGLEGAFIYEKRDWYATKGPVYSILRLYDLEDSSSLHPGIDKCEFNLNADGHIGTIEHIVENWVLPFTDTADREQLLYDSKRFRWDPDAQIFCFEADLEIPALSPCFCGDVFLDNQNVAESLSRKLWDGGDRRIGFRTKTPPMGSSHVRASIHKEFEFVYAGFSSRTVRRTIRIHMVDNIVDGDDLKQRLISLLADG